MVRQALHGCGRHELAKRTMPIHATPLGFKGSRLQTLNPTRTLNPKNPKPFLGVLGEMGAKSGFGFLGDLVFEG